MKKTPIRFRTKALLMALLFSVSLFCVPVKAWAESLAETWAMATRITDENLVYAVSNPSNCVIRFNLRIPAGETVSYAVELIPNDRTGSIDTKSGSYTNSGTGEIIKTVTVSAKYFSNKYTIYASYTTGPAANRTIYEDTDSATSALKTTVTSERFVWTQQLINQHKTAGFVAKTLVMGVATTISFKLSGAGAAVAILFVLDTAESAADTFVEREGNIRTTPKLNCGYAIRMTPGNGSYTWHMIEYDEAGEVVQTVSFGTVSVSTITVGVK